MFLVQAKSSIKTYKKTGRNGTEYVLRIRYEMMKSFDLPTDIRTVHFMFVRLQ